MKRLFLISICVVFVIPFTPLHAQEEVPLGNGNFAVKFDFINYTDDSFGDVLEDDGIYIGLEGYGKIFPNLYLGGEIGQATNESIFVGKDIIYVPIELNLKYAIEAVSNFVIDFGAGVSYNYVEIDDSGLFGSGDQEDDWLFGGQFFGDLTYKINGFSIGANVKYQITEDFQNEDFNLNNLRVGAQIGVIF